MTDPISTPAQMREAAALLPCPFCGSEAETVTGPVPRKWGVMCRACDAWRDDRCATAAEAIAAWNRRAQPENSRQHALQTGVCPMCEDCPDGCPVETPKDSRNKMTNAQRIRGMSDEELARWLVDATVCERVCHEDEYCHGNECVKRVTGWLRQPAETEGTE